MKKSLVALLVLSMALVLCVGNVFAAGSGAGAAAAAVIAVAEKEKVAKVAADMLAAGLTPGCLLAIGKLGMEEVSKVERRHISSGEWRATNTGMQMAIVAHVPEWYKPDKTYMVSAQCTGEVFLVVDGVSHYIGHWRDLKAK